MLWNKGIFFGRYEGCQKGFQAGILRFILLSNMCKQTTKERKRYSNYYLFFFKKNSTNNKKKGYQGVALEKTY